MSAARKLVDPYQSYEQEVVPVAKLKVKAKRKRMPATLKICIIAACCVAVSLLYLQQQVTTYYLNMELVQAQQQVIVMEQRNDHLMLNLESQRSLKQIEEIARTTLGMVDPVYTATLVVDQPQMMMAGETEGRWLSDPLEGENMGFFAMLTSWANKVLPLGGVEAGTLQR